MTADDSTPETPATDATASDADGARQRTRTRSRQTAKDRATDDAKGDATSTDTSDTSASESGGGASESGDGEGSTRRRRPRRGRRGRGGRRKGTEGGDATTETADQADATPDATADKKADSKSEAPRESGGESGGDSDAKDGDDASSTRTSTAKKSTARKSTAKASGAKTSTAKKSTAKKSTAKKSTAKKSGGRKSGGSGSSGGDDERIRQGGTRLAAKRSRSGGGGGSRRVSGISEELRRQMLDGPPKTMLVSVEPERTQIAILEERTLVEHNVTHRSDVTLVGNIYMARVQNVLPGMEAAFLDIGKGRNGVLYAGEVLYDDLDIEEGDAPRIEDALKSGQKVLVQVTKDAMGTKGPRLTMQLSLAGRYTVLAPNSDVFGISRKLTDKERDRLRKIVKKVKPSEHGIIVRTAAEGIPEEQLIADLERLLAKWAGIEERAAAAKALSVVYEEPPLHVKVIRDSFGPDFASCIIDDLEVHDAVRGYLDEVAPDLAEKIELYGMARYERDHAATPADTPTDTETPAETPADAPAETADETAADTAEAATPAPTEPVAEGERPRFAPLFDAYNVNDQLRKAMARKVWLPSGGYLIIESTEAMKVIDVNTGKYTGSKKTSLEEVVLKTNLEAAEEIVRQLRLRDIGGIIIIDFIDMLLKANQDQVVRRLKRELLRDRTKTRVSEVSRLGLVQMTRKNVSAGLVESFSHTCEQCEGRGFVNDFDA